MGRGESDVLLKLDTRSEEFMDYKHGFQEPEGKEEDNKDSVYLCWKIPAGEKMILKRLKIRNSRNSEKCLTKKGQNNN